jgi:tripartite-type tricarboxylate transporter receptor subunit TctC
VEGLRPCRGRYLMPKPTATDTSRRHFLGLFVPANTPRAIVDQLYRETEKALRTPGVMDKFKPQGIEPMPMTSAEFDALIKREIEINIALVKAANLKFN